jgi:hypothetical protein
LLTPPADDDGGDVLEGIADPAQAKHALATARWCELGCRTCSYDSGVADLVSVAVPCLLLRKLSFLSIQIWPLGLQVKHI